MFSPFARIRNDERGMSFVFVSLGFLAFLTATTLAIDVGMFMTGRSQAQNSADAGALSGATALVFDSFTDRTPSGPVVSSALSAARANNVISQPVSVGSGDVEFPNDPSGQPTRVKVTVYRTSARSNAVPTLMGRLFGVSTVDILATATAEASPADSATCVLPFTVPDKWIEHSDGKGVADGPWDPTKMFDLWYTKGSNQNGGVALPNPDVYVPPQPVGSSLTPTGFTLAADRGVELTLKANNTNNVSPSLYNPWDLPGSTGGNDYRNNIADCNTNLVKIGDNMVPEPGDMSGPTKQGVKDLIAKDPNAYWDSNCDNGAGCVMSGGSPNTRDDNSPRVGMVPLYDPSVYANGQQSGKSQPQLQVVNYLGFFVEKITAGGDVLGRIAPIVALKTGNTSYVGTFAKVIRLVQ